MVALLYAIAWEWINIALEYTATAWTGLPRWWLAVVGVNLVTHPVFVAMLDVIGRSYSSVLPCEICIVIVEAVLLMMVYGFRRWRRILAASVVMNAASYVTGLLVQMPNGLQ